MTRSHACITIALVLACACARFPSWPLASAVAVAAFTALVFAGIEAWAADRERATRKLIGEMAELRSAIAEHAKAISDLRHRSTMKNMDEGLPPAPASPFGTGFGFPRG